MHTLPIRDSFMFLSLFFYNAPFYPFATEKSSSPARNNPIPGDDLTYTKKQVKSKLFQIADLIRNEFFWRKYFV